MLIGSQPEESADPVGQKNIPVVLDQIVEERVTRSWINNRTSGLPTISKATLRPEEDTRVLIAGGITDPVIGLATKRADEVTVPRLLCNNRLGVR